MQLLFFIIIRFLCVANLSSSFRLYSTSSSIKSVVCVWYSIRALVFRLQRGKKPPTITSLTDCSPPQIHKWQYWADGDMRASWVDAIIMCSQPLSVVEYHTSGKLWKSLNPSTPIICWRNHFPFFMRHSCIVGDNLQPISSNYIWQWYKGKWIL